MKLAFCIIPFGQSGKLNWIPDHKQTRKRSLSAADEKKRVLKVISQFATHHSSIRFKLKSDGRIIFSSQNIVGNSSVQVNKKPFFHSFIPKLNST